MYDTWSDVMRPDNKGAYPISAHDAVRLLMESRKAVSVKNHFTTEQLDLLERSAFQYALEIPALTEEELLL